MDHSPVSEQRRALIVDDEIIFALNLEADMHALGFDICDLAAMDSKPQAPWLAPVWCKQEQTSVEQQLAIR